MQRAYTHITTMLHMAAYMLLTHKQATSIPHLCAACVHAHYYNAAYTLLKHKQASIPHSAACVHAYCYSAAYMLHMYTAYIRHMKCITYTFQ